MGMRVTNEQSDTAAEAAVRASWTGLEAPA